jgi:hypothetical protein
MKMIIHVQLILILTTLTHVRLSQTGVKNGTIPKDFIDKTYSLVSNSFLSTNLLGHLTSRGSEKCCML